MIGKSFQKIEPIAQLQAELHILTVEKLDACIRPLFTNPVTLYIYKMITMGYPCHCL